MKVKILGQEWYPGMKQIIYLRKMIIYNHEIAGDKIRIMSYGINTNGTIEKLYFSLDERELELLQEEL